MATAKKLKVLGAGSYGTVHLGLVYPSSASSPPAKLAVKSSEIDRAKSLHREAVFLKSLRGSPHVVQGFGDDVSSEEGGKVVYNLLMEYAPRGTLTGMIQSRGGKIPEFEISFYTHQLVKGIRDVHRIGAVHCDLKSDNVLLFPCRCGCGMNTLKLADFGLSKFESEDANDGFGNCHRGSLMYTSPESLLLGMYSAPKDIWAIGCMVLEMITGRYVWESLGTDEMMMKIAMGRPEIPAGVSFRARDFLERCFDRNPTSRWTADMLLTHPFIASHNRPYDLPVMMDRTWSSYDGLFSDSFFSYTIPQPPQPPCRPLPPPPGFQHILFPENKGDLPSMMRLAVFGH